MKKKFKKNKKPLLKAKKFPQFNLSLPEKARPWIGGVLMFLVALIIVLSFFDLAGFGGELFMSGFTYLIGKAVFLLPLLLVLGGLIFFSPGYQNKWQIGLAISFLLFGICGILAALDLTARQGGLVGYLSALPLMKIFSFWVTQAIFSAIVIIGGIILGYLLIPKESRFSPKGRFLYQKKPAQVKEDKEEKEEKEVKPGLIKKVFQPKFTVKEVPPPVPEEKKEEQLLTAPPIPDLELKTKPIESSVSNNLYKLPPLNVLEAEKGSPTSGDIKVNSAIIKRTLQNFDIEVEMSEINVGPTVTQYTFKPAEGVKLSKITGLGSDLSLALATHPIRIEAPIPGRALVGIELPNKGRATVRLKNLLEQPGFQNSLSNLTLALGRNVDGRPVFTDLARMPHLLVAGSTGSGKTICLNSIILSLLFQNSPEILRFIFIDPKRVEFPVYNGLPHLLTPVICDTQRAVNALKWLTGEMERRFTVLSEAKARNITDYNNAAIKEEREILPYIVLVIDELADLMAARGREIEAGIVRLAQMARAVGIHLIVATQRPSVEVITGLIKANITARIAFQVASQIDSRTILDMAGAEKLLGSGDMLFISSELSKPKRAQGAYISDKEIRRVVAFIKKQEIPLDVSANEEAEKIPEMEESLEKTLEEAKGEGFLDQEDQLYPEAKQIVIEAKKASASLLQRRLRIGYARAARLVDMLEEEGVVGPGEGAKPREVYIKEDKPDIADDGFQKI